MTMITHDEQPISFIAEEQAEVDEFCAMCGSDLKTAPRTMKVISETKEPSGGTRTTVHADGTQTQVSYGEIITTEYECPCGQGKIVSVYENIPGYRDRYAHIECHECNQF